MRGRRCLRWIGLMCGTLFALNAPLLAQGEPSQTGWLKGRVIAEDDGEPLPYSNIQLFKMTSEQDSLGFRVGGVFAAPPDGAYEAELEPGTYRILASYVSAEPTVIRNIRIRPGGTRTIEIRLKRRLLAMPAVEIRAKVVRDTEAAVLTQQRESAAVASAISSEQIKKSADSNAAEALTRVSGLSTVDNRYVFVRGLGERYSATLINGAPVGSPEPNKKVFPLDLIPAALLDNVFVQKTFTPDQPAEFGGGTVNIRTRDFPGEKLWSASVSTGYNSEATGQAFYTYRGGRYDWLGFDDGTRAVPDAVERLAGDKPIQRGSIVIPGHSMEEIAEMGRSFTDVWVGDKETGPPNYGLSLAYGNQFPIAGKPLGFLVGGVIKNSFDYSQGENNTYRDASMTEYALYDVEEWTAKTEIGAVSSISYRIDEFSSLFLRSLFNRSAKDAYRVYEGPNYDHGRPIRATRLHYLARSIWSSNLGMSHRLPGALLGIRLDWRISYSQAKMYEPDRREYQYEWFANPEQPEGGEWRATVRSLSQGFTRYFGELDEAERGVSLAMTLPFKPSCAECAKLKIGYDYSDKERDVGYRRFAFRWPQGSWDWSLPPDSLLTDENIGGSNSDWRVVELTRYSDAYGAGYRINASYYMLDAPFFGCFRLVTGARVESWKQEVTTLSPFSEEDVPIRARLEETDVLPSANLTYSFSPETSLRAGYSRTISRPDMRELTQFEMTDYESGWNLSGNPGLERAWLHNYDLRFEQYPSPQEYFSASLFYKRLIDPIENRLVIVGSQLRIVPTNAEKGYLYGSELEARLDLERLTRRLSPFFLAGNLTLVKSWAQLPRAGVQTSAERPLAGQSPYLINLMLFYDPQGKSYSVSLLFNRYGERLAGVGSSGQLDMYERPRSTVDLTLRYALGATKLKFTARNLLDEEMRIEQAGYLIRNEKSGRSFSLSISRSG